MTDKLLLSFPTKADFRAYVRALAKYWWLLVVAVIGGFADAIERLVRAMDNPDFDIPGWVWLTLVFAAIFIAQFLAWRDMRRERDQLRQYDVSQGVLTELANYRTALVDLQNESLPSEMECGSWKQRYDDLRGQIIQHIKDHISDAEGRAFETIGIFPSFRIAEKNYVNDEHIRTVSMIVRDHRWITSIILDYSRRKQRQTPPIAQQEEA